MTTETVLMWNLHGALGRLFSLERITMIVKTLMITFIGVPIMN